MAHPSLRTLLLLASLFGALHGQEFNPDAEVLTTQAPATGLPSINVNTSNVIHNNFQQAEPVVVPVTATPQVAVVDTAASTDTVVSPAVATSVLPTVNAVAAATPARLGVGFVPLGSLIASGMGVSGLGAASAMTTMGGLGTLGAALMPRLIIGR